MTDNINKPDEGYTEYYSEIAIRLKIVKLLLAAVTFIAIAFSVIGNVNEFTPENFSRLMRYIDIGAGDRPILEQFPIDVDENSRTAYFYNYTAVLKRGKITIYDSSGKVAMSRREAFSSPVISAGDKFILAYGVGGTKIEIFNTFANIFELDTGTVITFAKMAESGAFLYVTSDDKYRSVIYAFDSSFERISVSSRNEYVIAADLSDDGKTVVSLGYGAENGDYYFKASVVKGEEKASEEIIRGEMPLAVKFTESGFAAVSDSALRHFASNGAESAYYSYSGSPLKKYAIGNNIAAAALGADALGHSTKIVILSPKGEITEANLPSEPRDMMFTEDEAYLIALTADGLYRIDGTSATKLEAEYDETANRIIHAGDGSVWLTGLYSVDVVPIFDQEAES
ncbi:hypothetical protein FACS1894219_08160 [Clostridia bacterium]|nr:hypothetical protein FACS1894219_08160 [Clostridia bacterium]